MIDRRLGDAFMSGVKGSWTYHLIGGPLCGKVVEIEKGAEPVWVGPYEPKPDDLWSVMYVAGERAFRLYYASMHRFIPAISE